MNDKLTSSQLLLNIASRPTKTVLRNENEQTKTDFNKALGKTIIDKSIEIPKVFDGREVWKGLINPPYNQGNCGSCWAFASTGVLSDRFNIQSRGLMKVRLSPAKLILCDWRGDDELKTIKEYEKDKGYEKEEIVEDNASTLKTYSCYGNTLIDAFRYLHLLGTPTERCIPYGQDLGGELFFEDIGNFKNYADLPLCKTVTGEYQDMCADYLYNPRTGKEEGTPQRLYRCYNFNTIAGTKEQNGSEEIIKYNIYRWGPIASAIEVYTDFYEYDAKNSVYAWNKKAKKTGGHAIEIVGWGEKDNEKYWIVKNSWGKSWGDNGYFRIRRGVNECKIEENCIAGMPDFFYPENYKKINELMLESSILSDDKEIQKNRKMVDTSVGGINRETGYTRRVMSVMPWIDFKRPVDISLLPDWKNFVAGRDASFYGLKKVSEETEGSGSKTFSIIFLIISLFFLIIFVGFFIVLFLRRRKKFFHLNR